MKKWIHLLLIFLLFGCSNSAEPKMTLTISAAASMKDVLSSIKKQYEAKHPSVQLSFNFASTGTLKKQIEQGAPVDLFISASPDVFKELKNKGFIMPRQNDHLVYNELVLIASKTIKTPIHSPEDLTNKNIQTIAIGIPETVPAGAYAKQWLEAVHVWDKVKEKLILAKDVREVLTYVESGNAEAGIVYRTDALSSKKIDIAAQANHHLFKEPIVYEAGVIQSSPHKKQAKDFLYYLQSNETKKIFKEFGFILEER
jgi:molybdate transport system substrate-binding protein